MLGDQQVHVQHEKVPIKNVRDMGDTTKGSVRVGQLPKGNKQGGLNYYQQTNGYVGHLKDE